jgi:hypothetical protein
MATIYELAERLGKRVWESDNIRRIYMDDAGYNTRKTSTDVFIWQDGDTFKVSCYIGCPSQSYAWIVSQKRIIIDNVTHAINVALSDYYYLPVNNRTGKIFNGNEDVNREDYMMYDIDTFALEDDVITALGDKIDSYRIEKILRSDL